MSDHEATDGGQLRKGMRPGRNGKAGGLQLCAEADQNVMARVMAEGGEKGSEENPTPHAIAQARLQALGRVHQHVLATKGSQGGAQPGERGLALGAAMPRQGHDAPGLRGQRGVQRAGNGDKVALAREQGRGKANILEAGRGGTHRSCRLALQTTVRHVRGCHEHASRAALAQLGQRVGERGANGATACACAQRDARTDCSRQISNQSRDARVPALAGKAPGYDECVT